MYETNIDTSGPSALAINGAGLGSPLIQLLMASEIVPGTQPGYQLCKEIYANHILGAVLADAPITRAQAKPRELACSVLGEERLLEQFRTTWDEIGSDGATVLLHDLCSQSRIYGLSSIALLEDGVDPIKPLDLDRIATADLVFNVLDPLNTAGSLVLNQNPNSRDFKKPGPVSVNGKTYHPSRTCVKMNERPLYIEWTGSAFGFVGRSVYQRCLYPLKTFIQSMVTDQMVVQKAGLLVAKIESPSSFMDNVIQAFTGKRRGEIKAGVATQVVSIGTNEDIASLNLLNLEKPFEMARRDALDNIASACGMPASIIRAETLSTGLADGTEDAKKEAAYLDFIRQDMRRAYTWMDRLVMRKAWTREFYASLASYYPEYRTKPFETWLAEAMRAFKATWPNLLEEPDSKKSETAKVQFDAVVAVLETMLPEMDPENKALLLEWAAANVNERSELFAGKLDIDIDALKKHFESAQAQAEDALRASTEGEEEPHEPRPEGEES